MNFCPLTFRFSNSHACKSLQNIPNASQISLYGETFYSRTEKKHTITPSKKFSSHVLYLPIILIIYEIYIFRINQFMSIPFKIIDKTIMQFPRIKSQEIDLISVRTYFNHCFLFSFIN